MPKGEGWPCSSLRCSQEGHQFSSGIGGGGCGAPGGDHIQPSGWRGGAGGEARSRSSEPDSPAGKPLWKEIEIKFSPNDLLDQLLDRLSTRHRARASAHPLPPSVSEKASGRPNLNLLGGDRRHARGAGRSSDMVE
eukprot:scaffold167335_cov22-Tisochrysis_lutea.AAC.1